MEIERYGKLAVVLLDGIAFDDVISTLDLDDSSAHLRDLWLSQRYTPFLGGDSDNEGLFLRFNITADMSIAVVDVAYDADFRRWAGRTSVEFN